MSQYDMHGVLVGNLVADPEFHTFNSGDRLAEMRIACEKSWKDSNGEWDSRTSFFTVKADGYLCDYIEENFSKSDKVYVRYEPKQERWEKNGQNRSKVVFMAQRIVPVSEYEQQGGSSQGGSQKTPGEVLDDVDVGDDGDDIPF